MFAQATRFTFIWFPLKYPTIWKRHWYTFLLFLLPFLRIFWQLQEFANYKFASDGSMVLEYISSEANKFFYGLSTMIYVIKTCTAAVFNFLSFIKFYFYKQNHTPININEKSLLIVSFIVFLAQLWRTSYNVSRVLFPNNNEIILFYNIVLPVIYDIFALSGSLSLLALSKTTRKEYASFYLPKKFCMPHSINTVASSHPQLIVIKN